MCVVASVCEVGAASKPASKTRAHNIAEQSYQLTSHRCGPETAYRHFKTRNLEVYALRACAGWMTDQLPAVQLRQFFLRTLVKWVQMFTNSTLTQSVTPGFQHKAELDFTAPCHDGSNDAREPATEKTKVYHAQKSTRRSKRSFLCCFVSCCSYSRRRSRSFDFRPQCIGSAPKASAQGSVQICCARQCSHKNLSAPETFQQERPHRAYRSS
jgi:hypothetical protein